MDRRARAHLILVGMPENAATIGRNGGGHLILISLAKTSFTRSLGPKLEFCPGKGYDSMVQRCGNKRRIVGKGCDSRQPRRCDQERRVMDRMTDNRKGSLICRLGWPTTANECSSRRWIRVVDNGLWFGWPWLQLVFVSLLLCLSWWWVHLSREIHDNHP